MSRGMVLGAAFLLTALAAYFLMLAGEFVAAGASPEPPSINAFLFLVGLGGALVLLSPAPRPSRHRWR